MLSWMQAAGNRIERRVASHEGLPEACAADGNQAMIDGTVGTTLPRIDHLTVDRDV